MSRMQHLSDAGDLVGLDRPNNLIDCKLVKTVKSVFYRTKVRREVATAMGGQGEVRFRDKTG